MTTSRLRHGPMWPMADPKRQTIIGAALRAWRLEQRVSQSRLAKMLCVNQSLVSRYEAGIRVPHITLAPAIARVTGWDERDVALMIAGHDPAQYRREIAAAERGRIVSVP